MATEVAPVGASAAGVRTPARPAAPPADDSDVSQYRWWILLGLITAAIMEVLDTTIVNVALPQMAGNLGATFDEIGWVATGYILSNVVVLPMTAFFTATFGRKNYLTFSITLFAVASFLCGTSHTPHRSWWSWRVVQGAGGAALLSTAQATLRQVFPREQQGMVQALFILGIIVAPTLGPTLGGWITDNYTWNWIFFINIPIAALSIFLVTTFLHDPPWMKRKPEGIDILGISLLTVGLASLQYVLEEGKRYDWFQDADDHPAGGAVGGVSGGDAVVGADAPESASRSCNSGYSRTGSWRRRSSSSSRSDSACTAACSSSRCSPRRS